MTLRAAVLWLGFIASLAALVVALISAFARWERPRWTGEQCAQIEKQRAAWFGDESGAPACTP